MRLAHRPDSQEMLMAGFDVFLKLDGIDGESTIKGHEKEIELVSSAP